MAGIISRLFGKQSRKIKRLEKWLDKTYPDLVYKRFVKLTPKDTGYAQAHTAIKRDTNSFSIVAEKDYRDYAKVLDQGKYPKSPRGGKNKTTNGFSKQAPEGMSKPTKKYADKILKRYLRRLK